jgi:predicted phage tail protein
LQSDRKASFVSEGQVLMRETHGGAAWVAALAYVGFGAALFVWGAALVVGYLGVGHASGAIPPRAPRRRQREPRLERTPARA